MTDNIDWSKAYTARDINRPEIRPRKEPAIDKEASEVLGQPVRVNDPRLIKWAAKQSAKRDPGDLAPHSNFEDKASRDALKEHFRK